MRHWFGHNDNGRGLSVVPRGWQGWALTLLVLVVIGAMMIVRPDGADISPWLRLGVIAAAGGLFWYLSVRHFGDD